MLLVFLCGGSVTGAALLASSLTPPPQEGGNDLDAGDHWSSMGGSNLSNPLSARILSVFLGGGEGGRQWYYVEVKSMDSRARFSGVQSWLHHLLAS